MFEEIFGEFREMHKRHGELNQQFSRLCAEPSSKVPVVGSRVVVAVGMIGHGHPWIRGEGVVLECGDTSYKVKLDKEPTHSQQWTHWVHQALITDVLTQPQPVAAPPV